MGFELEPENAACYVLPSNIYVGAGNKHLCGNVEQQKQERGVKKQLVYTWIEVNNEVHTIVVDIQDHPQMTEFHAELQSCQGSCIMQGMCHLQNLFCMMWQRKKKRCFICVTMPRNLLLDSGSST
jgi:hypothetical protein